MRAADALAVLALTALLACARLGGGARGDDGEREVRVAGEPLSEAQRERLVAHARAGGRLYWRLPGGDGPRCEAWRLVPDPADPARGHLELVPPGAPEPAPSDISTDDPAPDLAPPDPAAISPAPAEPAPSDSLAASPLPPSPDPSDSLSGSPLRPSPVPSDSLAPSPLRLRPAPSDSLDAPPLRPSPAPSDILASSPFPPSPAPSTSLSALAPPARRPGSPEPWTILLTPESPGPSVSPQAPAPSDMSLGPSTMRFAYRLAEGHLTLTGPEHERPVAAAPGVQKAVVRALTCVFTGVSLADPSGRARRLVLAARDRFFFTDEACAGAGFDDEPPGDDELRALGCAGALADPATRARFDAPPPADAPDAAARLHRARAVHHLRRGPDGALVCDVWRNRPERAAGHGRLEHRGRDEHGVFVRSYAYDIGPGYLTLQGPAEFRRVRVEGRRTDLVRASSCIVTRGVTGVGGAAIDLGGERWYLSRRACDAARAAGAPAPARTSPQLVSGCE